MFTPEEKREIINGRLAEICSAKGITVDDQARNLDDIFTQAFASADSLFDRVDLIAKFESGYAQLLNASNWYRSNQKQFSDQKLEYDKFACTLDKLRRSPPDNYFDWNKLAAQFRAVPGRIETYSTPGPESGNELWHIERSQEVKRPYEALAKRGLKALGLPGGSKGPLCQ
jgi:hypothetical protein